MLNRVEQIEVLMDEIDQLTISENMPEADLRFECKKCPLFKECQGQNIENHIFDIPRLSKSKFDRLDESNIICIEDIPERFPLTANQSRVRVCVVSRQPYVSNSLKTKLADM